MAHMPLVSIDVMEGHSDEVHGALIEQCTALYAEIVAAPVERFRAWVNTYPPSRWGLGGQVAPERVSPLIRVELMEGRPPETLRRLISEMSALVANILDIPIDQTRVLLREIPPTHWGIGGVPASEARAAEVAARAAQMAQAQQSQ
jgi:4-oxalocrotonate tautomerase family enzyme